MSTDVVQQIQRLADLAFAQTEPVAVPRHSHRQPGRWLAIAAGLLVVLMTVALVSVRSGPDQIEPVDFSTGLSVHGALAEIPLSDLSAAPPLLVRAVDFDEIAALTGVDRVGFTESGGAWSQVFLCGAFDCGATPVVAPQVTDRLIQAARSPEDFESEFGWTGADVAATISWQGVGPPDDPRTILFDVFRLDSDVAALAERAGDDAVYEIGTGDDFESDFADTSPVRPIGVPLRVAVDAARSITAVSQSTPGAAAWLNGSEGSMADQPAGGELAAALDRTGDIYAFEASFGDFSMPQRFSDDPDLLTDQIGFEIDDFVITEGFTALGVGWSGIGDTQRTSIVYVFDSPEAADASVDAIAGLYAPEADFVDGGVAGEASTMSSVFVVDTVSASGSAVTVVGRAAPGVGPMDVLPVLTRASPLGIHR